MRRHRSQKSVTRELLVVPMRAAVVWVTWSFVIATYSTVVDKVPFPLEELSSQVVVAIVAPLVMKVVGNVFEHNNGGVFGESDK